MDPAESFGPYLKNERELRGITLEEIAAATKIHIKYLQALEDERYADLPGEVFVKGFLRSFAKAIGADGDDIVAAYDQLADKKFPERPVPSAFSENEKNQSSLSGVIIWGLLVVLAAAGYFYFKPFASKTRLPEIRENPQAIPEEPKFIPHAPYSPTTDFSPITIPILPPVPDAGRENGAHDGTEKSIPKNEKHGIIQPPMPVSSGETAGEEGLVSEAQTSSLKEPGNGEAIRENLVLVVGAKTASWFHLQVDSSAEYDFILPMGTEKTFHGKKELNLTIGNREGVRLTLNGKSLVPPSGRDNVVRNFIITHKLIE